MDVTDLIGGFGRWQAFFMGWSSVRGLLTAFNAFAYVFYIADSDHWCARTSDYQETAVDLWRNISGPLNPNTGLSDTCFMYSSTINRSDPYFYLSNMSTVECLEWEYNTTLYGKTLIVEWNLVCRNRWARSLLQSSYMVFMLVAILVQGLLSDRYGRRIIITSSAVVLTLSGLASLASKNYYLFLIARLGIGFGISGLQVPSHCLLAEVIGPKHRIALQIAYSYGWDVGMLALAGLMFLFRDWWYCQLVMTAVSILLLLTTPLLIESPRWLISTGRKEQAISTIQRIARINKRPTEDVANCVDILLRKKETESVKVENVSAISLFQSSPLRRNTIILLTGSFITGFVYFGAIKVTTMIGENPYESFAISAAVEAAACTLNLFITKFSKRRPALAFAYIGFGIFLLATALTPKDLINLRVGLMFAGQTCFTLAFTTKFIYENEFFPTIARCSAIGLGMTFSRSGAALEPWIRNMIFYNSETLLLITYSLMVIGLGIVFFLLPETFMNVLPDTVKEGQDICNKRIKLKALDRNEKAEDQVMERIL